MAIEEKRIYELTDEQTTLTDTDLGVLDKSSYDKAKKFSFLNLWNYIASKITPTQPAEIDVTQQTYYARLATGNTLKACTYNNGTSGVGATLTGNANGILSQSDQTDKVDNVTPALNDIILIKNQTSQLQNGLYVVTQLGSVSLPFILTRLEFYNEPSEVYPSVIFISEGTANQSRYFTQDTDAPTIGTSPLVFLSYTITPTPAQVIFVDTVTSAALPACTYANGSNVSAPASGATLKANANGALGTINGVTMNINARIIVKNQVNQAHNGIYQVIDQGTYSRPWVLRRVVADANAFYINREYPVTNPNSTFFGTRWSISSPLTMTNANWGTTNIVFSLNSTHDVITELTTPTIKLLALSGTVEQGRVVGANGIEFYSQLAGGGLCSMSIDSGKFGLREFSKASLPSVLNNTTGIKGVILVTDATPRPTICYSNGTNWIDIQTGVTVV